MGNQSKLGKQRKLIAQARKRANVMKDIQGAHLLDAPSQAGNPTKEQAEQIQTQLMQMQKQLAKPVYDDLASDYFLGLFNQTDEEGNPATADLNILRGFVGAAQAAAAVWMESLGFVEFNNEDEPDPETKGGISVDDAVLTDGGIALP